VASLSYWDLLGNKCALGIAWVQVGTKILQVIIRLRYVRFGWGWPYNFSHFTIVHLKDKKILSPHDESNGLKRMVIQEISTKASMWLSGLGYDRTFAEWYDWKELILRLRSKIGWIIIGSWSSWSSGSVYASTGTWLASSGSWLTSSCSWRVKHQGTSYGMLIKDSCCSSGIATNTGIIDNLLQELYKTSKQLLLKECASSLAQVYSFPD